MSAARATRIAGHPRGCACPGCFARLARYRKHRNLALVRGTWEHPAPTEQATAVLRELVAAGWTDRQIAAAAGLSGTYVRILLGGNPCQSAPATVRPATMAAISALGNADRLGAAVPDSVLVDATGSIRRLRALAFIGWPQPELAARLGLTKPLHLPTGNLIGADKARAIAALYAQLWNQPGPSNSAAMRARAAGWAPPAAWDDDEIDDPRASADGIRPDTPARTGNSKWTPREVTQEEIRFLLAAGVPIEQAAARVDVTVGYAKFLAGMWATSPTA
jgi:hypothetical protein